MVDRSRTVTSAAIRINGTGEVWDVPAPGRHHDVIRRMAEAGIPTPIGAEPEFTQGFVLSDGTFATRWKARQVAVRSGQIVKAKWGNELYSEDLW